MFIDDRNIAQRKSDAFYFARKWMDRLLYFPFKMGNNICTQKSYTFPRTGAIPIITEANAERTCWDESVDSSYSRQKSQIIKQAAAEEQ